MNESPSAKPEKSRPDAVRNGIRWDALAAIIASLVGLLALFVAGYTAYIQREQVRAEVWPYLELGESDALPNDVLGGESHGGMLVALNKGVGPAIVRSVVVRVDGKPQRDWKHALAALGLAESTRFGKSSFNRSVLSPGEQLNYMIVADPQEWVRFKSNLGRRLVIQSCYCSALGECWTSMLGARAKRHWGQPVEACPATKETDQFRD